MVHGFGEHSDRYKTLVEGLVPHGYALYAFDLRGHGRSQGRRGHITSWEDYRQDVHTFLKMAQEQAGDIPLFLYGHSMGGLIVLDYGLTHPEGLAGVIASGPVLAQPGVAPLLLLVSRLISRVFPAFSLDTHLDAEAISRDPEVVRAYKADPLVHSTASARLGTELTATVKKTLARAGEWRLPLLILHGSEDRLSPPEGSRLFFERVPIQDKERIVYPGGYHEPHNDVQRDQTVRDLLRWLDAHLPGESARP